MDGGLLYGCLTPHPPVLVPQVAGHRVEQVRQTREAMQTVAGDIRTLSPDALVLVSPHAPINPSAMTLIVAERYVGSFGPFGAPEVRVSARGDAKLAAGIESECRALGVPVGRVGKAGGVHRLDHGAAVPLFFLAEARVSCDLVLASFSALDVETHRRFGRAISAAVRTAGKRAVLVASGDFSHRLTPDAPAGFTPLGREFDAAIVAALRKQDRRAILEIDEAMQYEAGECGYRSLVIALGAFPEAEVEVLSYEGPFGVGYLVARFKPHGEWDSPVGVTGRVGLSPEEREALRLARLAVESFVNDGALPDVPPPSCGLLAERSGVFVSLKLGGQLRGCIGTIYPTEPSIAEEILRNAVAAATSDPRFPPMTREELPHLEYSIDVLSELEPVESLGDLDPARYGVVVQAGARRGLLLPDLEGIGSVEQQVEIARRKAGIPARTAVRLYRFTVRRIREE